MLSPIRKHDTHSPKKIRHQTIKEEEDNAFDVIFDLFAQNPSKCPWYYIRIPGILPPKRSFHTSVIINNM